MNTLAPLWRRILISAVWLVGVVAMIVVLHRLGSGSLSTPPFTDGERLQVWMNERGAITAAFALLRLVALVLAWYLLVVTIAGLVARATRIPRLVALADLATVPALRRVLGVAAGLGLTASATTLVLGSTVADQRPAVVADGGWAPRGSVIIERLPDGSSLIIQRIPDDEGGTATMRVVPPSAPAPARPAAWTAAAGDHFWHIAHATLVEAWSRTPTDSEVVPYWRAIIDANRSKLADRANPDLIYPGQVFDLPAPPPVPG